MGRRAWVLILGIWAALGQAAAQTIEANSCVNCHQEPTGVQRVDRNYHQWKDSWHAARKVTCDKCHGGKPAETRAPAAHSGMLESEGKKGPSYYLKMDERCGQCHSAEYADFSTSSHYKFLQQGKGPSCITCHHPKTGHTFTVKEIVASCVDCHNDSLKGYEHVPQVARLLLESLSQAEFTVSCMREFVTIKEDVRQKAFIRSKLVAAEMEIANGKKQWHRFNLQNTEAHILHAFFLAREAKALCVAK